MSRRFIIQLSFVGSLLCCCEVGGSFVSESVIAFGYGIADVDGIGAESVNGLVRFCLGFC